MTSRSVVILLLTAILLSCASLTALTEACCPVASFNKPVVNADQTVIVIWDAARQTQHFIRKASFESEAEDFGFIVPSPSQPELEESGSEAFPLLAKLTEPEVKKRLRPISIGCSAHLSPGRTLEDAMCCGVNVLEKKEVAGFNATVLETKSSHALLAWLKENGYAYSAEVEAWAKPYIEQGWKFTALKIAKKPSSTAKSGKAVDAASLRISFKTERPLFPYREPDPKAFAEALGKKDRLLRIYFLAEARYRGDLSKESPWTGNAVWAGTISQESRRSLLAALKLPGDRGPAGMWLTEFEDHWPYQAAPADLYFSRDRNQQKLRRDPIVQYVSSGWPQDGSIYALGAVVVVPPVLRLVRRSRKVCRA